MAERMGQRAERIGHGEQRDGGVADRGDWDPPSS
jgi:hypothetical protein